jgi:phage terminase small subunit
VVEDTYKKNPEAWQFARDALRKVRELAVELGLVTGPSKRLWKAFGIWDEPRRAATVR